MAEHFRALIVDDDAEMRQSLAVLLERSDWVVDAVGSAQVALSRIVATAPDVVLSDVRMPGMSGLELLDEMSRRPAPPLVLISAHGDIPMAVDAIQNGAYSFLEKPFEPRRLLTVLKHAAEQHRLSDMTKRMREQLVSLSGLDRVLLGSDLRVAELKAEAVDLALSDAPVLITGKPGQARSWWRGRCTGWARGATRNSWRSIVRRWRLAVWKSRCLEQPKRCLAVSARQMAGHCFWTRSPPVRSRCRSSCCARWKRV